MYSYFVLVYSTCCVIDRHCVVCFKRRIPQTGISSNIKPYYHGILSLNIGVPQGNVVGSILFIYYWLQPHAKKFGDFHKIITFRLYFRPEVSLLLKFITVIGNIKEIHVCYSSLTDRNTLPIRLLPRHENADGLRGALRRVQAPAARVVALRQCTPQFWYYRVQHVAFLA